jgi:hypothetical protein
MVINNSSLLQLCTVLVVLAMVGTNPQSLVTAAPFAVPVAGSQTVSLNHHGAHFIRVVPTVTTHIFDKRGDEQSDDDLARDWLHLKNCSAEGSGRKDCIYYKRELEFAEGEEEEELL